MKMTGTSRVAGSRLQFAADMKAVVPRHDHVEQHQIRLGTGRELQGLPAIGGGQDFVTMRLQHPGQQRQAGRACHRR